MRKAAPWWLCDICWWPSRRRWGWFSDCLPPQKGHQSCVKYLGECFPRNSVVTRLDYRMNGAPELDDSVLH